ncbi:spore germination protein, partial [Bacillus mycoides]|uniref:spore germination protein n=2 Tax=Bacillus TaxID=1386 RepID=UPI0003E284B8
VANLVVQNSTGSFNLGDFYNVSPKENTKSYNGSGSSNVGFVVNTFSGVSATNTFDADVADQNQVGTA